MRFGNPSKKAKVVASLRGHAIEFPGKGTPKDKIPPGAEVSSDGVVYVYVPPAMHSEVLAQGLLSESEIEEKEPSKLPVKPQDAEKLKEAAFEAFDMLVEVNERESFSGNGYPKAQAIEKLLGYALTTGEIKDLWNAYRLEKKDA